MGDEVVGRVPPTSGENLKSFMDSLDVCACFAKWSFRANFPGNLEPGKALKTMFRFWCCMV